MNVVVGEYPPEHIAPHGTVWSDRDGLTWLQRGKSILLDHLGPYEVRGGRDWQVFSPHGVEGGIMWSSANIGQKSAVASSVSHVMNGSPDETDSYHTYFPIRRTFRLKALVLPVHSYGDGDLNVKVGLYERQTTRQFWSSKLADSRLLFSQEGQTPIASPNLIPFHDPLQDGLILRKGSELFVRAVWGSQLSNTYLIARFPVEYSNSGDNFFRADRKTSLDSDFTLDIADLMATEYTGSFGTTADNMAKVDWGMYGDFLD